MTFLYSDLTARIIAAAIKVHKELGPGLLESAYKESLHYFLLNDNLSTEKEKSIRLNVNSVYLDCGYRIDMVVENKIVVEIKSIDALAPIHTAQTLTYMKLGNYRLGLLINFNVEVLTKGIKRLINGYD